MDFRGRNVDFAGPRSGRFSGAERPDPALAVGPSPGLVRGGGIFRIRAIASDEGKRYLARSARLAGRRKARAASMLGRRQVVRHRFLVPTFPGSNPGAPANFPGSASPAAQVRRSLCVPAEKTDRATISSTVNLTLAAPFFRRYY